MITNSDGRIAIRSVWRLTWLGLGAGLLTVGIIAWVLRALDREQAQLAAVQGRAIALFARVDPALTAARDDLYGLLSGVRAQAGDWDAELSSVLSDHSVMGAGADFSAWRADASQAFGRLGEQRELCADWRRRVDEADRRVGEAHERLDAALEAMREDLMRAVGHVRLQAAIQLREMRALSDAEMAARARQLMAEADPTTELHRAMIELAELARVCERLMATSNPDELTHFKDNLLKSSIGRLEPIARALDSMAEQLGGPTTPLLARVAAELFGEGYIDDTAHQTIIPATEECAYSSVSRRLAVNTEKEGLRYEVDERLEAAREARSELSELSSKASQRLAVRIGEELTSAMVRVVAVGLLASVFFMMIAVRAARAIHAQIRTIGQGQRELEQANRELETQKADLEKLLEDLQATNRALERASEAAEQASRAKSEFLANMSHEIRTPMTAILGFAENLAEQSRDSEQAEALTTILRNGRHLLGIINDILDLSKVEAGKMTVEKLRHSPCQIVAEVESMMKVKADIAKLAFRIEFEGEIPETIETDPTRLRQILINLVGNAIKFTREGGVRLVTSCVSSDAAPSMQFDVIDTGIGMTSEEAARLFVPFSQADSSTTRRFGGTGLGLSISKRFAEMLGGDIRVVESTPGVGTRIRVTIATGPLAGVRMVRNPMVTPVLAAVKRQQPEGSRPLEGCRILLAEDGPDNQRLVSFVLRKAGAEVEIRENGELAVEAALQARDAGTPFDCILMDMQMPVLDGYEATHRLRDAGYREPIIAFTAHAMDGDRDKCAAAGCDDYATKPIDRAALLATIRKYVKAAAAV